jgi:hypothetical protein
MIGAAIDEVAAATRAGAAGHADMAAGHADIDELAARLASIWAMVAELDPALAARLRSYCPDTR